VNPKLIALDGDTGNVDWDYEFDRISGSYENYSPTIDQNGNIYFIGNKDTLFTINPDGTEKWQRRFPAIALDGSEIFDRCVVNPPSIGSDGTIYIVVRGEKEWKSVSDMGWLSGLHAIDPENPGQERWEPKYCFNFDGTPAIDPSGNIYVACWNNASGTPGVWIYGFDPQGNELEAWPTEGFWVQSVNNSLVVDNEGIIYYCSRNALRAFDSLGNEIWLIGLGKPGGLLSIGKNGNLYIPGQESIHTILSEGTEDDIRIPDTGQTKCYDADGNEIIPCPNPGEPFYGQDANYAPCNPHSYTKLDSNGNPLPDDAPWPWAMVRDNVTGLIWEVKTDDDPPDIHDKDNTYDWYDAQDVFIATINSQNFGGHNDWRLPTVKELSFIIDNSKQYPSPTINTDYFPNTPSSYYWSSTTSFYRNYPDALFVHFQTGRTVCVFHRDKSAWGYVRAVRGSTSSQSFTKLDADGNDLPDDAPWPWSMVRDNVTGLIWEVKTLDNMNITYNWQQALSYCETLPLADYSDWRLPNRNELQSLVDYSRFWHGIDTTFFPNTVLSSYWSSTTNAALPRSAWDVDFHYGFVSGDVKSGSCFVRAVRAGQCGSFDDLDGDGVYDNYDNCWEVSNPDQLDSDGDCPDPPYSSDPACGDACEEVPFCANNTREGTEVCDGEDLGGETCETQGYSGGMLSCLPDCSGYDFSISRGQIFPWLLLEK